MSFSDNMLIRQALEQLTTRLPPDWRAKVATTEAFSAKIDAIVELAAPDGTTTSIAFECKQRLEPMNVDAAAQQVRAAMPTGPVVVISRYLSPSTRERLWDRHIGYLDLTGNVRLAVAKPGLYIETAGATEDPERQNRPARTLKGLKAGRIVRALIDRTEAPGVRELAALTGLDAGYVSRVLSLLETEALITRAGRGRIASVDWPRLLRRWAQEAPLDSRGVVGLYLDVRGTANLVKQLANSDEKYAITGTFAAAHFAPIAPARLASVWLQDVEAAAVRLGLRQTDSGANAMLIEPRDEGFCGLSPPWGHLVRRTKSGRSRPAD